MGAHHYILIFCAFASSHLVTQCTSLLNLAEQIEYFGSIRDYWDGDKEAAIQEIKPQLPGLRKTLTFFQTKLVSMRKMKFIDFLKASNFFSELDGSESTDRGWFTGLYRYETYEEILTRLEEGDAISGFIHPSDSNDADNDSIFDTVYVCFGRTRRDGSFSVISIKVDSISPNRATECGLNYHKCELEPERTAKVLTKETLSSAQPEYCMMLPYWKDKFDFNKTFGVVTDQWRTIGRDGRLCQPEYCDVLFNDFLP